MKMTKQPQTLVDHVDSNHYDEDVPIVYSINIEALTTSKRSLTCSVVTEAPRVPKQRANSPLPSTTKDGCHIRSVEKTGRPSIQLPVTYSTSIHIPCRSQLIQPRPSTISPSQSSRHHYHHYHHHHHHHYHQPLPTSTSIKPKPLLQYRSTSSTESTSTDTSPNSLSVSKKSRNNIHSSLPIPTSDARNRQSTHYSSPTLPPYPSLLRNWLHPTARKLPSPHKGGQSEYSEVCRHESPSKRRLLFNLLTSAAVKPSKPRR